MGPGEPGPRSHISTATVSQTFTQNWHLTATRMWPSEKEHDFGSALIVGKSDLPRRALATISSLAGNQRSTVSSAFPPSERRTSRLAADRRQEFGYPPFHRCKRPLALRGANTGLQFFQEGDEALRRRRCNFFVFSAEGGAYCTANATQLACVWPGVPGCSLAACGGERGAACLGSDTCQCV
jgi:hypothetical protein